MCGGSRRPPGAQGECHRPPGYLLEGEVEGRVGAKKIALGEPGEGCPDP